MNEIKELTHKSIKEFGDYPDIDLKSINKDNCLDLYLLP